MQVSKGINVFMPLSWFLICWFGTFVYTYISCQVFDKKFFWSDILFATVNSQNSSWECEHTVCPTF